MRGGARILQYWIFDSASSPAATTVTRDIRISEEQYLALIRATEASGFGGPPPVGLQLPSWDFYWVVNACADGRWHLNAWRQGQPGWDKLTFDKVLFAMDPTGVPVRAAPVWPRSWTEADYRQSYGRSMSNPDTKESDSFQLQVGADGLSGNLRAF